MCRPPQERGLWPTTKVAVGPICLQQLETRGLWRQCLEVTDYHDQRLQPLAHDAISNTEDSRMMQCQQQTQSYVTRKQEGEIRKSQRHKQLYRNTWQTTIGAEPHVDALLLHSAATKSIDLFRPPPQEDLPLNSIRDTNLQASRAGMNRLLNWMVSFNHPKPTWSRWRSPYARLLAQRRS